MPKRLVVLFNAVLVGFFNNVSTELNSVLQNGGIPAFYGDSKKMSKSTVITVKDSILIVYINGEISVIMVMTGIIPTMSVYTDKSIEEATLQGIYLFSRYLKIQVSIKDDAFFVQIEPSVVYKRLQIATLLRHTTPSSKKIGLLLNSIKKPDSIYGKGYLLLENILPFLG